jgi:hypothetical protein
VAKGHKKNFLFPAASTHATFRSVNRRRTMPKGSIRNPGTGKTMTQRKARASINSQDKAVRNLWRAERAEMAKKKMYDATKAPRGGPGIENPFKALKRRAAAKKK